MDPSHPLRLTIVLEQAKPLTGRIGIAESEMRDFSSWIGLAYELDRLLDQTDSEAVEHER